MSRPYRPSNGTAGMIFEEKHCEVCSNFDEGSCDIYFNAALYEIDEPEYPKEWIYDENDIPTCTKFERK